MSRTGKHGCQFPDCPEPGSGILLIWSQIYTGEFYDNGRRKQKTKASRSITLCQYHLDQQFEEAILTLPNPRVNSIMRLQAKKSKGKKKDAQKKREKRERKAQ